MNDPPAAYASAGGGFMEGTWNVYFENEVVGTCTIEQRGLYSCILCRCAEVTTGICRLAVQCADQTLDFGVMIPEGGVLYLKRSIPAKKLPKGQLQFSVQPEQWRKETTFIPLQNGAPFEHLSKLNNAKLVRRNGEIGVILE